MYFGCTRSRILNLQGLYLLSSIIVSSLSEEHFAMQMPLYTFSYRSFKSIYQHAYLILVFVDI